MIFARSSVLAATILILAALPASAAPEPSFDCRTAKEAAEKAICADEELAALDLGIAEVFKAALGQLDLASSTALRADQRAWIGARNARFAGEDLKNLKAEMEQRQAMLRETYFAASRFLGNWVNASGSVLIKDRRGLIVSFDPADCDISGEPRETAEAIVFGSANSRDSENWSPRITRRGPLLKVEWVAPKNTKTPKPVCANGRTIEGLYFPAGH